VAALFGSLDEGAGALSLEKLGNLLVRQLRFLFLSYLGGPVHSKTAFGHQLSHCKPMFLVVLV
jgi:hypothetical protein